ncbi:TIGR03083 family protein [Geodermatophilus africanus]|uniref:TIGR03083 family protein n=1 Tax=Geodermatophilus africanus TaxID=1137993 RepID=A0A1H3MGI5_9ACTN|nr:maleylpyruvate isomerase family mycothiol-dependent enzyme [Geodermatophilus africanus]SDY75800.1 TIGR03083 family protein [Geodermatophilus africanus]
MGLDSAPDTEAVYRIATANRLLAADMFADLTPEQWRTPSLCAGWTIREVAAHLLEPLETQVGTLKLLAYLVRYRGSLDRMVDDTARRVAARPTDELVSGLRERASTRLAPPVVGPLGPMTDTCIHLRDAARPLGLDVCPPPASWRPALDFLVSTPASRGFIPRDRLVGLRLVATDQDWQHGAGAEILGSSEAVAMAVSGRPAALDDLTGAGTDVLRARVAPSSPAES